MLQSILYIDCINKVVKNSSITLFADDTMIVVKDSNINTAIEKLNDDLNRVYNWLNARKLMLNIDKTKWMLIARSKIEGKLPEVKIDNIVIERVSQMKYLGIVIVEKIKFEQQVNICMKKTAGKVNFLSRISKNMTFDTRKIIYNTIVLPQFEYCSTIYFSCNKNQIASMQKMQNRGMRIILKCNSETPREFMLNALGWMSISQRIK